MRESTFASLLLGSLLIFVSPGTAQIPIAPVEARGFSALTSYEELTGFRSNRSHIPGRGEKCFP